MSAKFIALLMCMSLTASCGFGKKKNKIKDSSLSPEQITLLSDKVRDYCLMSMQDYQADGYVHSRGDGALFTALRGAVCDDVDMTSFEYKAEPGRFNRAPERAGFVTMPDDPDADSTDSKDMAVGRAIYFWLKNDRSAVERIVAYGKAHNWTMCEAKTLEAQISKCQWSIGLIKIHLDMLDRMNGAPTGTTFDKEKEQLDKTISPENQTMELYGLNVIPLNKGFRAHLDVLMAYLRGQVYGGIDESDIKLLRGQAERQPNNALFAGVKALYEDGNMNPAWNLLMDESRFPATRLPHPHREFCTEYLYQRDEDGKDWVPCLDAPDVSHSGTDFLFAARVVLNRVIYP